MRAIRHPGFAFTVQERYKQDSARTWEGRGEPHLFPRRGLACSPGTSREAINVPCRIAVENDEVVSCRLEDACWSEPGTETRNNDCSYLHFRRET